MYFSLLFIVCILFWNDTSESTHFPFLLGSARLGEHGGWGATSNVVVLHAKSLSFFDVFRN